MGAKPGGPMHHGAELTVVVIAIVALCVGAAMLTLARRLEVPYTIALMVLGLCVGMFVDASPEAHALAPRLLASAAGMSADLIIFVFLPALVFESAFALDAYGFRRNLGPILVLAVIGLLIGTGLAAGTMLALTAGSWAWGVPAALVFGALISATDPVAVVAILRDLGAPKRLGILIEGESLMNDGTAIVLFNVLLGLLVSAGAGSVDVGASLVEFVRVVAGGVLVGGALAFVAGFWMSRTFNEPMIEITLTIVIAYAAMAIAEAGLHVSGVMAIVTAGLWMGSEGRTRVSPEVQHFLHQFWEMLAYLANTVIFLLVGVLVGAQIEQASWGDGLVIVGAYLALQVIRFALAFGLLPLMNRLGDPISRAQTTVIAWSGLRGAVSLALALVVSQRPEVPEALRQQILLATSGVVFLTIVVNGGGVGKLLTRYGFDRPPPSEQLAHADAKATVLDNVKTRIAELSHELRNVEWEAVERELAEKRERVEGELQAARAELASAEHGEQAAGYFRQALNVERQAYWRAFSHGILSARALRILHREIEVQLDRMGRGEDAVPESRLPETRDALSRLAGALRGAGFSPGGLPFEHVALRYDLARAVSLTADRVLEFIDGMKAADEGQLERMRKVYRSYRNEARERLEDLRVNLPEVAQAIETRLARRIELNLEREDYEALVKSGAWDHQAAQPVLEEVEAQMKRLLLAPTAVELPETVDLCRRAPLFSELDDDALHELAVLTIEKVYPKGEVLFRQGDRGDSMCVIARGAVQVCLGGGDDEEVVDVLGGGDIIGEMSLLSGQPRTATCRAATSVTVGEIRRDAFEQLMRTHPDLSEGVWRAYVLRELDNYLRARLGLGQAQRMAVRESTEVRTLRDGEAVELERGALFLAHGKLTGAGGDVSGPAMVEARGRLTAAASSHLALLPEPVVAPPPEASPSHRPPALT